MRLRDREGLRTSLRLQVRDTEAERVVCVPEGGDGVAVGEGVGAAEALGDALGDRLREGVREGGLPVMEALAVRVGVGEGGDAVRDRVCVRDREALGVAERLGVGAVPERVLCDADAEAGLADGVRVAEDVPEPVPLKVRVGRAVRLRVTLPDGDRDRVGVRGRLRLRERVCERLPEGLRVPVPLRLAVPVAVDTEAEVL